MQTQSAVAVWPSAGSSVSALTLAREMAALGRVSLAPPPFPEDAAVGDGQPVIVIPGFSAPEISTARLREFLTRQNFLPYSWTGGFNIGPMRNVLDEIERQVLHVTEKTGRPVSLIGVSLGGTTAREAAKRCPDHIARVTTLVSPIHFPVVTPLAPLARAAALLWDADALGDLKAVAEPPPVPLTAIVCPTDGIIEWRASVPAKSDLVEIVEIAGAHMTICSSPEAQRVVADRLAKSA